MEFDPVGSAQSIPHMIKNDTLIEVLDQDQLSDVEDLLYILNQVQSKYRVPDRFKAIRHIFTDFGEGSDFDSNKFLEFVRALVRCLHLDILDSIAAIIESTFSKLLLVVPEIDVNAKGHNYETALMKASANGHQEVVKLLITFPGTNVNAECYHNETALMKTTKGGHHEIEIC